MGVGAGPAPLRPRRRRRWLRVVAVGVAVVLVTLAVDLAVLWSRPGRLDVHPPGSGGGGTTWLLVGVDGRAFVDDADAAARFGTDQDVPGERADSLTLLRLPEEGPARVLGIPRSLLVDGGSGVRARIGTLFAPDPQVLLDRLCADLGVGVDHVVAVRMDGLVDVVDALGGVEIMVDRPLRDGWAGVRIEESGVRHLRGDDALAYVRSRRGIVFDGGAWRREDGETARSERSRALLAALGGGVHDARTRPWELQRLAWVASGAVDLDQTLGAADTVALLDVVRGLAAEPTVLQLPVVTTDAVVPVAVLAGGADQVLSELRGPSTACVGRPVEFVEGTDRRSGT